jgi:hypothetical protein
MTIRNKGYPSGDPVRDRLRRKADQEWDMAGLARQDGDMAMVAMVASMLPANAWEKAFEPFLAEIRKEQGFENVGLQELERAADGLAQQAAWLSAYLGARGANGCGDSGHDAAVKYADKQRRAIRRVLGYTQP